jgi:threonyl-tRNA synthetase
MPKVSLPDGSVRDVGPSTVLADLVPADAIVARVDGALVDLRREIGAVAPGAEVAVEPILPSNADGLHVMRHSAAHVLAQAVCDLFPGAKYAIGPAIQDGFYYDFDLPDPLTPDDLPRIEKRMRQIVASSQSFVREELTRGEAQERFAEQPYKREIIESAEAAEGVTGPEVTVYSNGSWADLCRGPHVPSTDRLGVFRLTHLAGAYWRGDEHRPQLQRVYGTAWATEEDLAAYLQRLEEAERRDHRRLGRELDLFSSPDELGAGLFVWHARGGIFRKQLEDFEREIHLSHGYDPVFSPHIARSVMWETSGHLAKYADNMYPPMHDENDVDYYVKPMNCPFHVLIYKSRTRSYRDLPMRLFELGTIYRHERAGTLHGMLRVRGGTQDDSHIICRRDQLVDEILRCFELTLEIHHTFGFSDFVINLSTKPGVAIGDERMWAEATEYLRDALEKSGLEYTVAEGEGAFYGPKVDFHARDAIGRLWQLTTVQCDFALPERFDMEYMGEDNERHRPVMIHRAILGTLERFTAVLIEHYAGDFPLWLAPEQVRIIPVADRHVAHCEGLASAWRERGLRASVDGSRERMQKKIRDAQLMKVPYAVVIGDRDIEAGTIAVRDRAGTEVRGLDPSAFVDAIATEAISRSVAGVDLQTLAAT